MQVVILAGGLGTRLGVLTRQCPKVLVEVCGKPFLEHQLQWLAGYGLRDVVLCVGHLADQIEAFAKDGRDFGVRLRYSHEEGKLLGTGGALKRAEGFLEETFCVLNGDSYLPINPLPPIRHFGASGLQAMMLVFRNHGRYDRSNTAVSDGLVAAYNRRHQTELEWIDYGLRIFSKDVLQLIPPDTSCDLDVVYQGLIDRRQLGAYPVREPFYEIGSVNGLARFTRYLEQTSVLIA